MKEILLLLLITFISNTSSQIIKLEDNNFEEVIDGYENLLVNFYTIWCEECNLLDQEY